MNFAKLADKTTLQATIKSLQKRNIEVFVVDNKNKALEKAKNLIPQGSEVMTGSSTTLDQIGFTDLLKSGKHPWKNLKEEIVNEKDPEKQNALRVKSSAAEYFLGSVHAITKEGEVLIASASGSQLPAYAFSSPHVIWTVGTQKIVPTFAIAIERIEKYTFPLEDKRMKSIGYPGSAVNKILVIRGEFGKRIKMILVKEVLGF